MKKPINIHEFLNEFDKAFGHKRLDVRISSADSKTIYIQITYMRNVPFCKDKCWGDPVLFKRENDLTNIYAMMRITVDQISGKNKIGLVEKDGEYRMYFDYDGIYINPYLMPDKDLAEEFWKAKRQVAANHNAVTSPIDDTKDGVWQGFIIGHAPVLLGEKLTKKAIEKLEQYLVRAFSTLDCLAEGELKSLDPRPHVLLYANDREHQYKELCQKIVNSMETYDCLRFAQPYNTDMLKPKKERKTA